MKDFFQKFLHCKCFWKTHMLYPDFQKILGRKLDDTTLSRIHGGQDTGTDHKMMRSKEGCMNRSRMCSITWFANGEMNTFKEERTDVRIPGSMR